MAEGTGPIRAELVMAFLGALPPLILPVIILGGIVLGIVTVTEAAVLAVAYAFILSVLVYREVSLSALPEIAFQVVRITVPVLIIIAVSNLFAWIITTEQVPQRLTEFFSTVAPTALIFLLLINLLLLMIGTFMESNALIIILIPILMPVVNQYDIDPLHFGVMFVVNLCIGANTPPLGVTLMTASRIAQVPFAQTSRAVVPFLAAMVAVLLLTIFFSVPVHLPALDPVVIKAELSSQRACNNEYRYTDSKLGQRGNGRIAAAFGRKPCGSPVSAREPRSRPTMKFPAATRSP